MNCIIIDDEPLARDEMESLIREVSTLEVTGKFSNANSAMEFLKTHQADLLFLDIQMPGLTGLEFASHIPKESLVIFTTAYPQYALKSYELDAIDYLLKPIDKLRLEKAIRKATLYKKMLSDAALQNTVEGNNSDYLFIKADRRYHKVKFRDILYIEGLKDYTMIFTPHQKLITALNLKNIHLKMPSESFIRVSKSFIVNLEHVDSFDNHNVYIADTAIPLGDIYRNDFLDRYWNI